MCAPSSDARSSAPRTYGVVPDAAMPTTKSRGADAVRGHRMRAIAGDVLGALLRLVSAGKSAGNDPLHHLGIGAEGGRALARVEHAESARGARADVEQAPAGAKGLLRELDRARDRVALRGDRIEHEAVFGVQQIDDLAGEWRDRCPRCGDFVAR